MPDYTYSSTGITVPTGEQLLVSVYSSAGKYPAGVSLYPGGPFDKISVISPSTGDTVYVLPGEPGVVSQVKYIPVTGTSPATSVLVSARSLNYTVPDTHSEDIFSQVSTFFDFFEDRDLLLRYWNAWQMMATDAAAIVRDTDLDDNILEMQPYHTRRNLVMKVDYADVTFTPTADYPYEFTWDINAVSIPTMKSFVMRSDAKTLSADVDYQVATGTIRFKEIPARNGESLYYFCPNVQVDDGRVNANFGVLFGINDTSSDSYLDALQGLWYAFFNGPSVENIENAISSVCGLPIADDGGIVTYSDATRLELSDGEVFEMASGVAPRYVVGDYVRSYGTVTEGVTAHDRATSGNHLNAISNSVLLNLFANGADRARMRDKLTAAQYAQLMRSLLKWHVHLIRIDFDKVLRMEEFYGSALGKIIRDFRPKQDYFYVIMSGEFGRADATLTDDYTAQLQYAVDYTVSKNPGDFFDITGMTSGYKNWEEPSSRHIKNALCVQATCSAYDPGVTATSADVDTVNDKIVIANYYEANDQITYTTTGSAIGGLTPGNSYFVQAATSADFSLAGTTYSATAIDLTNGGSGNHVFSAANEYQLTCISRPDYTIASGDILSYDIYVDPNTPRSGTPSISIELESSSGLLRALGATDREGLPSYSAPSASIGNWCHREIAIPSAMIGGNLNWLASAGANGGVHVAAEHDGLYSIKAMFSNICIKGSSGNVKLWVNKGESTYTTGGYEVGYYTPAGLSIWDSRDNVLVFECTRDAKFSSGQAAEVRFSPVLAEISGAADFLEYDIYIDPLSPTYRMALDYRIEDASSADVITEKNLGSASWVKMESSITSSTDVPPGASGVSYIISPTSAATNAHVRYETTAIASGAYARFSTYLRTSSGTASIELAVLNNVGALGPSAFVEVDENWRYYAVEGAVSAASTGVTIIIGGNSTIVASSSPIFAYYPSASTGQNFRLSTSGVDLYNAGISCSPAYDLTAATGGWLHRVIPIGSGATSAATGRGSSGAYIYACCWSENEGTHKAYIKNVKISSPSGSGRYVMYSNDAAPYENSPRSTGYSNVSLYVKPGSAIPSYNVTITASAAGVDTTNDRVIYLHHNFRDWDIVQYRPLGTVIGGLTASAYYFVRDAQVSGFSLTSAYGSAKLDLTSSGNSGQIFSMDPIIGAKTDANIVDASDAFAIFYKPSLYDHLYDVTVDATGADPDTDTIIAQDHRFTTSDVVRYIPDSASGIGGLTSGAQYWVVSPTSSGFKLSRTSGGSAIDLTSAGTSFYTFTGAVSAIGKGALGFACGSRELV